MIRHGYINAAACLLCLYFNVPVFAQTLEDLPSDTLKTDSIPADTSGVPIPNDSTGLVHDSILPGFDSLGITDSTLGEEEPPLPPPTRLIDSLVHYFARHEYRFEVRDLDLYPRDAAGFLYHEASYYTITSLETPLRTTVNPFGLPGRRMSVRSNANEVAPYDRTIPADGLIDYTDISTGDVAEAAIIEGPLAGYNSLNGGVSLLYLKPFAIPEKQAESRFTVERGAFGYAYTRGRVARMFSQKFGFAFSTDYRKGDGLISNVDDDSYNVKARVFRLLNRRTTLDASIGVYRRNGGYLSYRRLRRDEQWAVSITRQEFFGGQLTGRYNLDLSRSEDVTKTIRPRNTYTELSYLLPYKGALYQVSIRFGREQYYINQLYSSRFYGFGDLSGFHELLGGRLFFFGRIRHADNQDIALESTAGFSRMLGDRWKMMISGGYLGGWPDLTDLYLPEKLWGPGLTERGNIDLEAEKKLTGNAMLSYIADKIEVSASVNAGKVEDLIYYDRRDEQSPIIQIVPDNDNVTFADLNLSGSFHDLWWFYGKASMTGRRIDSDRYGDSMPYSPRWQVYGQLGLKYYVKRYEVDVRLFGDMTYTEPPLSYSMLELQTTAVFNWGVNASLKDLTFYYMMHNASNQFHLQPEGYGYTGWFYSWGFSWKFLD